jgi:myo-inositol-1-phosphate synthase
MALKIKTETQVPRVGLMMVGWGGNNGSTVTAAILANRHNVSYNTKCGVVTPNYFGSVTQASTVSLGRDREGKEVYVPLGKLVPMVNPNDFELDGWDISGRDLAASMKNAQVLDYELQQKLAPMMAKMKPRASYYQADFIAANQEDRADNLMTQKHKSEILDQIRADIRDFKQSKNLDTVIVLWTANTERFSRVSNGIHDTEENVLKAIKNNEAEISPSTLFAVASILENVSSDNV